MEIDTDALRYFEVLGQYKIVSLLIGAAQRIRQGNVHDARLAVMPLQLASSQTGLLKLIKAAT